MSVEKVSLLSGNKFRCPIKMNSNIFLQLWCKISIFFFPHLWCQIFSLLFSFISTRDVNDNRSFTCPATLASTYNRKKKKNDANKIIAHLSVLWAMSKTMINNLVEFREQRPAYLPGRKAHVKHKININI